MRGNKNPRTHVESTYLRRLHAFRFVRRASGRREGKGGTRVCKSNIGKTEGTRETRRLSGSLENRVRLIYNNHSILITRDFILVECICRPHVVVE